MRPVDRDASVTPKRKLEKEKGEIQSHDIPKRKKNKEI